MAGAAQGLVPGLRGGGGGAHSRQTIAVVAHYDTVGVAPGLATGADSNGSGVPNPLSSARAGYHFAIASH